MARKRAADSEYSAKDIGVLKNIDAIRKNPGQFIRDAGAFGLHHLINELIDNAVDEHMAGYCQNVTVKLNADGSCTVIDDGRGVPVGPMVDKDPEINGRPAVEVVFTRLYAGGKFGKSAYAVSGGLHGVGVTCVNALSEWCEVEVHVDGQFYEIRFERGITSQPLRVVGKTDRHGTRVTFQPDPKVFRETREFSYSRVLRRLRELAFLNPSLSLRLIDEREEKTREESLCHPEGLRAFVAYLNEGKEVLHNDVILIQATVPYEGDEEYVGYDISVEVALQWTDRDSENIAGFTNQIFQAEGGSHVTGLRTGITNAVKKYLRSDLYTDPKRKKSTARASKKKGAKKPAEPTGDDIREGLTAVVAVKHPHPVFAGQFKIRLAASDIESVVQSVVYEQLYDHMERNKRTARALGDKAMVAMAAREAARRTRESIKRKSALFANGLPTKLVDCHTKNPEESELFLVEGPSAGGTAKLGRDPETQAILSLRGKILNVEKARIEKMLQHEDIDAIIRALGTGIGKDDFDAAKLRYHKIIIMTDADVDGSHIATLLLTFFFRQMRTLVADGHVYLAQPPLYFVTWKGRKRERYVQTEAQMDSMLLAEGLQDAALRVRGTPTAIEGAALKDVLARVAKLESYDHRLRKKGISLARFIGLRNATTLDFPEKIGRVNGELHVFYTTDEVEAFSRAHPQIIWRSDEDVPSEVDRDAQLLIEFHSADFDQLAETLEALEALGFSPSTVLGNGNGMDRVPASAGSNGSAAAKKQKKAGKAAGKKKTKKKGSAKSAARKPDDDAKTEPLLTVVTPRSELPLASLWDVLQAIREAGRDGMEIKRFKGLGEMNEDQLAETTMNVKQRTLLKVELDDAYAADRMFTVLMGTQVEPRREFIERYALEVTNIDV